jgi:N6-adenosine-specific RNA methylase IME4
VSKKYKTILLDPPWPPAAGTDYTERTKGEYFPKLSYEDIEAMPLCPFIAETAHIYVWVMNNDKCEDSARRLIRNLGFQYKQRLIWLKVTKAGKPHTSMGWYFRRTYESLFFGVRGKLKGNSNTLPDMMLARRGRTAEKPDESYRFIEAMSPEPRLELYARRRMPGWHVWGDEVESDIDLKWSPGRAKLPSIALSPLRHRR